MWTHDQGIVKLVKNSSGQIDLQCAVCFKIRRITVHGKISSNKEHSHNSF